MRVNAGSPSTVSELSGVTPLRAPDSSARLRLEAKSFWTQGRAYRLHLYRSGDLSLREMLAWASRAPREVPKVNGEFEFITLHTPEAAD